MDKIGPIARSDRPFYWPPQRDVRALKVGYVEGEGAPADRPELKVLRELGVRLVPITLPDRYPVGALRFILEVEAATVFDELLRRGDTAGVENWAVVFRKSQFTPAVEYLRANRIRTLLMRAMEEVMEKVDVYVGPDNVLLTNLTGHPCVVLPNGFQKSDKVETPTALTFTGRLYGETELLAVAHAYQEATGFHLRRPPLAAG
jgi:Asp-tRNA(Asn)/Glu-tRNA(Gln) amidotransferase A subunit family amidase